MGIKDILLDFLFNELIIMNENIDLTKILKDCPKGWKFYSSIYGDVAFRGIENDSANPIKFFLLDEDNIEKYGSCTAQGLYAPYYKGECTFFPSKDQRDWNKFTASWYKKEKFDPKTLKPFNKVLVRDSCSCQWRCAFYSHTKETPNTLKYVTENSVYEYCIPYNNDTKHLIGTTKEAPEYYRYWEN